ncbi:MAG: 12-oxophytodienoate reductase [Candidatus Eisenbacteria bacterium]|nr:12-oxophytodienoate reductase [Candidatus Eisenbacteria bacterium]
MAPRLGYPLRMSSTIFEPCQFGRLTLRNRIVMAPMTRRMAQPDGIVTEESLRYYARRAAGEVGLIISEGTALDDLHACDTLTVPRIQTAEQWAAWRQVVDAVHAEGSAFAPQLWHTGRLALDPIGPSAGPGPKRADGSSRPDTREMAEADFAQVLDAFRNAARGAVAISADALEIHGAHGYLLDSFVSTVTNRRTDRYGGSFENRMRFPLEVVRAVRVEVGPGFPIIYRFSQWKMDDYAEQKFKTPDDLRLFVTALRDAGVDILHVSTRDATDLEFESSGLPPRTLAGWSRHFSGLPTIAVGKVTVTLGMDESYGDRASEIVDPAPWLALIESGEADLLAIGRALIANPDWVPLVRAGRWRELQPYHKGLLAQLW